MKNAFLSVVLLGGLGASFLAGAWYHQRVAVGAASLQGRTILYYVDPMHPAYTSDQPGTAPDCGMPLEPVYIDGRSAGAVRASPAPGAPAGTVHVSAEKQQLIGVRMAAVDKTAATEQLRFYGRVAADETASYRIEVGIDGGFIQYLSSVTTGTLVRKDQWLATFSAPDVRSPIQAFLVGLEVLDRSKTAGDNRTQIDVANASLQQSIDRLLTLGVSRMQIEEISRTRQLPANIRITAPAEGFVLARNVSIGQRIDRGDELYRIADLRRVWILADVSGPVAARVRPGTTVHVSIPGDTASLRARVSTDVLPQFDAVTHAVQLRLEAENPDYLLRPGMFVDVDVPITLPPAIAVPVEAVRDSGLEKIVFVEHGTGDFEARLVRTGWRFGGRVEIVDGLVPGERIVVSGVFLLDSESRLQHTRARPESAR
jgi:membrane fusion protein, copper/silver efflux system